MVELYEALYTTRSMRRVRPDRIPESVVQQMIDAAIRAPTGGLKQLWRFIVIEDAAVKAELHELYREAFAELSREHYAKNPEDLARTSSAHWLVDHLREVPLLIAVVTQDDSGGASTYPAIWSLMLAARGLGAGTTMTTILGQFRHDETCRVLGVPYGEGWRLSALVTCGLPLGQWGVAERRPAHEVTFQDMWDRPPSWRLPNPLWQPRP